MTTYNNFHIQILVPPLPLPPPRCQEEFQLRSSQPYMRSRVLEAEQGICQLCGLHAHDLFLKVRGAPPPQRKEMLENTWLAQLSLKQVGTRGLIPHEGPASRFTGGESNALMLRGC